MGDVTIDIDIDERSLEAGVEGVAGFTEERLGEAGKAAGKSFATNFVGGTKGVWQSFTAEAGKYNQTVERGTKLERERVTAAKEVLKQHREMHAMRRADEIMRGGGPGTSRFGPYGGRSGRSGVSYAADAVGALGNYAYSAGSAQGVVGLMNAGGQAALSMAGANAGWGQLLNVVTNFITAGLDEYEQVREAGLRGFQVAGSGGADIAMGNAGALAGYGFTSAQRAALMTNLGRRAGYVNDFALQNIAKGEATFGIGNEMTALSGAVARTGARVGDSALPDSDAHYHAIGLAIAEGMGRGRMGEAFEEITTALEAQTRAQSDVIGVANRMLFISQLGQQYVGNTAAKRQMEGTLQSLAGGGTTGASRLAALQAAGLGGDTSFAGAMLRMATGLTETGEGMQSTKVLEANFGRYVPAWISADEAEKENLSMIISQLTGVNQREVFSIMERLARGPLGQVDASAGAVGFHGAKAPDKLLEPRTLRAAKEAVKSDVGESVHDWMFGPSVFEKMQQQMQQQQSPNPGMTVTPIDPNVTSDDFRKKYDTGASGSFGDSRMHKGKMLSHPGVDLYFPPGTEVHAPDDGTIGYVGFFGTAGGKKDPNDGHLVVLDGATTGVRYKMFHLWHVSVRSGQQVTKGQVIGRTRDRDWAKTKSHLHAETYRQGKRLDPAETMNMADFLGPQGMTPGPSASPGISSGDPGPVSAPAQVESGGGGTTQVKVIVEDRTKHGVTAQEAQTNFNDKAREPAPGDVPALSK